MNPSVQDIIAQLKNIPVVSPKYCGNCGSAHVQDDFSIAHREDGLVVLRIGCQSCGVTYMLRIQAGVPGIAVQKLELLSTDVSQAEFKKFAGKSKVEKDEAIDIYNDMQEVSNLDEFLQLLEKSSDALGE